MLNNRKLHLIRSLNLVGLISCSLISHSHAASIDTSMPYASYIAQVAHSGSMLGLHKRGNGKLTPQQFECFDHYHLSQMTDIVNGLIKENIPKDDLRQLDNFFAKPEANKILQVALNDGSINEDLSNDKNLTKSEKTQFKKFSKTAVYQKYFVNENGYNAFSAQNNQEIFIPLVRQSFDYCQIDRNVLKQR